MRFCGRLGALFLEVLGTAFLESLGADLRGLLGVAPKQIFTESLEPGLWVRQAGTLPIRALRANFIESPRETPG
jgi:hypothetical protein